MTVWVTSRTNIVIRGAARGLGGILPKKKVGIILLCD